MKKRKRLTMYESLADGEVKTEALRIARAMVKDELKRQGVKVSHVEASEITTAAIYLINHDNIVKLAAREIRKRKAQLKEIKL